LKRWPDTQDQGGALHPIPAAAPRLEIAGRQGSSARMPGPEPDGEPALPLDLDRIYREHAAAVSVWVRRLLGPRGDVEDVLHEVFLVAQRRLPGFRGEAKISTWLYAITVRVVQSHRRKGSRFRWLRWLGMGGAVADQPPAPTPLQALESRQALELTYQLLDQLPETERIALVLFELEGLSGEEIAAITGDAVGTIWVRLHRARARFRKAFVAWESCQRRPHDQMNWPAEGGPRR
jgi:RNA polymerase sigma-70 factor, ECF subfamily